MKEKIEQLEVIKNDIDTMISILKGEFKKTSLFGTGTIAEQIFCYDKEGDDFTSVFHSIIAEHGNEPCPFDLE